MHVMKRFAPLMFIAFALGCGCREAPPTPHSRRTAEREQTASPAEAPAQGRPEEDAAEPEPLADVPARFAPNDRYGWPDDFLLPLVIEMETPEVPESIRGPSPPIDPP